MKAQTLSFIKKPDVTEDTLEKIDRKLNPVNSYHFFLPIQFPLSSVCLFFLFVCLFLADVFRIPCMKSLMCDVVET